tara:strand:+ start:55 stop:384 length:330 start_codon:yes stop_codon:yes gene_type:complete
MPYYNNRQRVKRLDKKELQSFLEKRNLDTIIFRENFIFNNVDTEDYFFIEHVWGHGDRLFKLARKYLGSFKNYWIIGLFNKKPTDANYKPGDIVYIPTRPSEYYREVVK